MLVWYEGSGTNDRRWLHADERGSVIAVTDGNGNASAINTYDEYGIPGANNQGRFQYTGQAWLPEVGLYDYKARMYSPTLGRFMQTDPIGYGDGLNQYGYAHGDPVNGIDPSGLTCEPGLADTNNDGCADIVVTARTHNELGFDAVPTSIPVGTIQSPIFDLTSDEPEPPLQMMDIVVTARRKTITLPNLNPSTFYKHFLDGSGTTVCLTPSQFRTLAGTGTPRGNPILRSDGRLGQQTSYYNTPYALVIGTGTVILDPGSKAAVGFYDSYDFHYRSGRSSAAQIETAGGASGYLIGAKDFDTEYNTGDCR